jgi:hypothetical protein
MKPHDPITYRHPRTLEEAFGPYERWGPIVDKDEDFPDMTLGEAVLIYVSVLTFSFLIINVLQGLFQ